jgi:hypothetical protein
MSVEEGLAVTAVLNNTQDFTRFKLACHAFLRAVATEDHPLLILRFFGGGWSFW